MRQAAPVYREKPLSEKGRKGNDKKGLLKSVFDPFLGRLDDTVGEAFVHHVLVQPCQDDGEDLGTHVVQMQVFHHEDHQCAGERQSHPRDGKEHEKPSDKFVRGAEIDLGVHQETAQQPGVYTDHVSRKHMHVGSAHQHVKDTEIQNLARSADDRVDDKVPVFLEESHVFSVLLLTDNTFYPAISTPGFPKQTNVTLKNKPGKKKSPGLGYF